MKKNLNLLEKQFFLNINERVAETDMRKTNMKEMTKITIS